MIEVVPPHAPARVEHGLDERLVRRVVLLACVVLAAAMATAATLYPTYRAPDEPAHVDQVRAIRATWRPPDVGARMLSQQVVSSYALVGHRSGVPGQAPPLAAEAAPGRSTRPSFAAIALDRPTDLRNQMPQHPPLYYLLAAAWSLPLGLVGHVAFDAEVLWLRLLGVVLVTPLPWFAARAAAALGAAPATRITAAVATLGVPMLVHIGGSVNNDTLLIALGAATTPHLAAVVEGDLRRGRAIALGGLVGAALLTKAFAFALLAGLVAAYLVRAARAIGNERRDALRALAVAGATAALVGGWWWVRNVLRYGTIQPGGGVDPVPPAGFVADPVAWLGVFAGRMVRRWWIEPDTVARTTPVLVVVATVLVLTAVAVAVVRRDRAVTRSAVTVLLVPVMASLALVVLAAWRVYARTGIPFAIHGRYLFPGLAGVAVAVAVAVSRHRAARGLLIVSAAGATFQIVAAIWTLPTYWGSGGRGPSLAAFRAWLAWSPIPPALTLGVVAVGIAAALGALVLTVGAVRVPRRRLLSDVSA